MYVFTCIQSGEVRSNHMCSFFLSQIPPAICTVTQAHYVFETPNTLNTFAYEEAQLLGQALCLHFL